MYPVMENLNDIKNRDITQHVHDHVGSMIRVESDGDECDAVESHSLEVDGTSTLGSTEQIEEETEDILLQPSIIISKTPPTVINRDMLSNENIDSSRLTVDTLSSQAVTVSSLCAEYSYYVRIDGYNEECLSCASSERTMLESEDEWDDEIMQNSEENITLSHSLSSSSDHTELETTRDPMRVYIEKKKPQKHKETFFLKPPEQSLLFYGRILINYMRCVFEQFPHTITTMETTIDPSYSNKHKRRSHLSLDGIYGCSMYTNQRKLHTDDPDEFFNTETTIKTKPHSVISSTDTQELCLTFTIDSAQTLFSLTKVINCIYSTMLSILSRDAVGMDKIIDLMAHRQSMKYKNHNFYSLARGLFHGMLRKDEWGSSRLTIHLELETDILFLNNWFLLAFLTCLRRNPKTFVYFTSRNANSILCVSHTMLHNSNLLLPPSYILRMCHAVSNLFVYFDTFDVNELHQAFCSKDTIPYTVDGIAFSQKAIVDCKNIKKALHNVYHVLKQYNKLKFRIFLDIYNHSQPMPTQFHATKIVQEKPTPAILQEKLSCVLETIQEMKTILHVESFVSLDKK